MAKMTTRDNKWLLQQNISSPGTVNRTIHTRDTFVGKDIEIETTTPEGYEDITGGELSPGSGSTSLIASGLSDGQSVDSTKTIALTEQGAAGYYELQASGSGTVSRAAVNKQVFAAGFFNRDFSPVESIAAESETSNTQVKPYYVKQSTLSTNSITPLTSQQTVTIGDGYYHENRTVTIDAMNLATFSNEETNGVNYNDISSTAPVLNSGGYLFVNAGYSDNVKISLAQLVPNASDISGHSEYILYGHTAYDDDGALVTGSIPTYDHTFTVT